MTISKKWLFIGAGAAVLVYLAYKRGSATAAEAQRQATIEALGNDARVDAPKAISLDPGAPIATPVTGNASLNVDPQRDPGTLSDLAPSGPIRIR